MGSRSNFGFGIILIGGFLEITSVSSREIREQDRIGKLIDFTFPKLFHPPTYLDWVLFIPFLGTTFSSSMLDHSLSLCLTPRTPIAIYCPPLPSLIHPTLNLAILSTFSFSFRIGPMLLRHS